MIPYNCLKFRQKIFLLLCLPLLFTACGKAFPWKLSSSSNLILESKCNSSSIPSNEIIKKISDLYNEQTTKNPQNFFFIEARTYNFENPLILSLDSLQKDYQNLISDTNLDNRSADLFYLFNNSKRFESQRCQFASLAEKKRADFRPYLNLTHDCLKITNKKTCDETQYANLDSVKENWMKNNIIDLCLSFSKRISCNQEYKLSKLNNSLSSMVTKYQNRFEVERFETLFKLRPTHNKFSCQKDNEKILMSLKVFSPTILSNHLRELLNEVERTWSRGSFQLKLEIVDTLVPEAIEIISTNQFVSYVPDENNKIIYLSNVQDFFTIKKTIAHEFGHVLGFPDCYIEFFDDTKKELVYYEISKNYTNIMCSMKDGVRVPDEYFEQLAENSCKFNQN